MELLGIHDELFHWITTYHGAMANIMPPERNEMLDVIDNDEAFDRWMDSYNRKLELDASRARRGSGGGGDGRVVMGKEAILGRLRGKDVDD